MDLIHHLQFDDCHGTNTLVRETGIDITEVFRQEQIKLKDLETPRFDLEIELMKRAEEWAPSGREPTIPIHRLEQWIEREKPDFAKDFIEQLNQGNLVLQPTLVKHEEFFYRDEFLAHYYKDPDLLIDALKDAGWLHQIPVGLPENPTISPLINRDLLLHERTLEAPSVTDPIGGPLESVLTRIASSSDEERRQVGIDILRRHADPTSPEPQLPGFSDLSGHTQSVLGDMLASGIDPNSHRDMILVKERSFQNVDHLIDSKGRNPDLGSAPTNEPDNPREVSSDLASNQKEDSQSQTKTSANHVVDDAKEPRESILEATVAYPAADTGQPWASGLEPLDHDAQHLISDLRGHLETLRSRADTALCARSLNHAEMVLAVLHGAGISQADIENRIPPELRSEVLSRIERKLPDAPPQPGDLREVAAGYASHIDSEFEKIWEGPLLSQTVIETIENARSSRAPILEGLTARHEPLTAAKRASLRDFIDAEIAFIENSPKKTVYTKRAEHLVGNIGRYLQEYGYEAPQKSKAFFHLVKNLEIPKDLSGDSLACVSALQSDLHFGRHIKDKVKEQLFEVNVFHISQVGTDDQQKLLQTLDQKLVWEARDARIAVSDEKGSGLLASDSIGKFKGLQKEDMPDIDDALWRGFRREEKRAKRGMSL